MVLNNVNCNSCKVYNLTWSEYGSSLITTAQHLRNKEDLTDVTISAGGKIFPAHKLVLSAASPLLMELLKNTKCQHPILMLAGISAADLETILDFIYQDIQALSPTALILNTSQEPALLSTAVNQENSNNDTKVSLSKTVSVTTNNTLTKESESEFTSQKRKRRVKSAEVNSLKKTDFSSTCKKSFFLSHGEDAIISTHPNTAQEISKQKTVSKSPGTENENQKEDVISARK